MCAPTRRLIVDTSNWPELPRAGELAEANTDTQHDTSPFLRNNNAGEPTWRELVDDEGISFDKMCIPHHK